MMARIDAIKLLTSASDKEIAERMFGETPWIFAGDAAAFAAWRKDVADAAICSAEQVYVVGSAMFGYSLSPTKPGRAFRRGGQDEIERSDIDVLIVSELLFTEAWHALLRMDWNGGLGGTRDWRDKIRTDVYWGHVTNTTVPPGSGPARLFRKAMAITTERTPFRGHTAKARVYRRRDDALAYHTNSLRELRRELEVLR